MKKIITATLLVVGSVNASSSEKCTYMMEKYSENAEKARHYHENNDRINYCVHLGLAIFHLMDDDCKDMIMLYKPAKELLLSSETAFKKDCEDYR